ncbi:hypothetical protein [Streptomyces sp. enrichment culture]|uniref:hypothetical protein n=1 Tax=Streptomyces sp. enrichment culture TaxID=1795815 RepID=UPI003F570A85
MSTAPVPRRPPPPRRPAPPDPQPVPPHTSEATRLMCAGTYQDAAYRNRVIDELYVQEHRIAAPALGHDAARVLAHALRARREHLKWSAAVLALWVVGLPLSGWLLAGPLLAGLVLALAPGRKAGRPAPAYRPLVLAAGWLLVAAALAVLLGVAFGAGSSSGPGSSYDSGSSYGTSSPYGDSSSSYGSAGGTLDPLDGLPAGLGGGGAEPWQAWIGLGTLALVALCTAARRERYTRVFVEELSEGGFTELADDPAERADGERFRRVMERIRREQRAPLVLYDEAGPFRGAGARRDTWVLAVELRPVPGTPQQPLSNRVILDKVRPMLEQLRVPAEHADPEAVRDRLRRLEIDECVFLPVDGLARREEAPSSPQDFEQHRARAVEEGGERRRHFLRIRVGGWEEELVVTVFVRVHTQGGMLMLEVAPHVLPPVRAAYRDVERDALRMRGAPAFARAAAALGQVPASAGPALVALCRGAVEQWRLLTDGHADLPPEGPAVSVRELAAAAPGSTFQMMDVDRYLRSIQDRIGRGVRRALADAGYETGEFVQKIVNVSNGAVHIGRVEGSTFAIGEHARAGHRGPGPQRGPSEDDT